MMTNDRETAAASEGAAVDGAVTVGAVRDRRTFVEASALYTATFGYGAESTLNTRLMRAIVLSGGVAVAARDGAGTLVGFAYGFPGHSPAGPGCLEETYLYSQAAFVVPALQSAGIGRRLKAEQRRLAREAGYRTMRWSFDPALSRNAHVNFDVLGACSRRLVRDYYDDGSSDRLIVDWPLTERPAPAIPPFTGDGAPAAWAHRQDAGGAVFVTVPRAQTHLSATLRERLSATLDAVLAAGHVLRSCRVVDADTSVYTALPASDAA